MSRAEGNVLGEEVSVGDIVQINRDLRGQYRLNTNDTFDLSEGERLRVSRVNNESLSVRTVETKMVRDTSTYGSRARVPRQVSFTIDRRFLMFDDPNYVPPPPPPPPRKLGLKPEGDEFLSVDDPRIQWIWDDLGAYADKKNWCPQYDELCKDVGIPGRPRDFNVTRTLNGIQIRASIKARSQTEANQMFETAMSSPSSE